MNIDTAELKNICKSQDNCNNCPLADICGSDYFPGLYLSNILEYIENVYRAYKEE